MARHVNKNRVLRLQRHYAKVYGVDQRFLPILAAQIEQESGFQTNLGSPAGARDVAQFIPSTAKTYGVTLGDNKIRDDIRGQVRMMAPLLKKYGVEGALRAYNAGPGAIQASHAYAETNAYVQNVKQLAHKYGQVQGDDTDTGGSPGTPARYGTIPGVDNSAVRQQAKFAYLAQRGRPGALLDLKQALDAAQDTPSRRVQTRGSRPGTQSPGSTGRKVNGELYELFWNGQGATNVKNGQRVGKGFVSGHTDHVHVAAKQKDLLKLGHIAERMGLHVGENPAFGGVDPVHVQDSFHYGRHEKKGEFDRALDVSGDPAKMAAFAKVVAHLYGV